MRGHLEEAARAGNANAIQNLEGPEFPEQIRYLWEWHKELRMGVREMMTWTDLRSWTEMMSVAPTLGENEALFYLDLIYRNPPKE